MPSRDATFVWEKPTWEGKGTPKTSEEETKSDDSAVVTEKAHVNTDVVEAGAETNARKAVSSPESIASDDVKTGRAKAFSLKGINFRAELGKLTAVVGSVGSGKSTLLSAMLGELVKTEGYLARR